MVTRFQLVAFAVGLLGCAADAPVVPTGSLGPVYLAQDTGNGTVRVVGEMRLDDGAYRLTEDELLVAKVGDQTTEMSLSETSEDARYVASLPIAAVAETRFAIDLHRAPGELITSTMAFPAPFEVSAVAPSVPRDEVVTISWTPVDLGADTTNVIIDARPCTPRFHNADTDPATVMFTMTGPADQDCSVTVGFFRDREADTNPAFDEAGVLYAEQARFVSFMSTH
jgi:hypothetical protein